jgi:hypothetical protein
MKAKTDEFRDEVFEMATRAAAAAMDANTRERRHIAPTIRKTVIIAFASTAALVGQAKSSPFLSVGGFGAEGCGHFLKAVDDEHKARPFNAKPNSIYTMDYFIFENYALGFLSGANWASASLGDNKDAAVGSSGTDDFAGPMIWLENYCRDHPLDNYIAGVIHLRAILAAREGPR